MKTRPRKAAKAAIEGASTTKTIINQARPLEQSVANPPSIFILPKDISTDARILTITKSILNTKPLRLLVCPNKGFFEFANVAEARACRSWLLAPERSDNISKDITEDCNDQGYVLQRPDLLIATPLDPLFVLIPIMIGSQDNQNSYLSCSDYVFNTELDSYQQLQQLLRQPTFAEMLKRIECRMSAISDNISLGDEADPMYRLSMDRLVLVLLSKSIRTADNGLPASLEQRFIRQALDVPFVSTTQDEPSTASVIEMNTVTHPSSEASQDSVLSTNTLDSDSTAATSLSDIPETVNSPSKEVVRLLRIRTAWDYMLKSYISDSLHPKLTTVLKQQTMLDFKPLAEHEERIFGLRQKAQALRTLSDNISRKRTLDDDGASAKADEKRRKREEEEQRKKNISHGVKKLMKANTSGMQKLSSFFTKVPAK